MKHGTDKHKTRARTSRLTRYIGGIVCSCLTIAGTTAADPPEFTQGNVLYQQGDYAAAAEAYRSVLDQGAFSPALLYNHGNALRASGRIGRAILQYRRALRLTPRDQDIRTNLRAARLAVPESNLTSRPLWRRCLGWLSLGEWTLLTTLLVWLGCGFLSWGELRGTTAPPWKWTLAIGSVWALSLGALGFVWHTEYGATHAVVGDRGATVRYGPLDESPRLQELPEGMEIRVTEEQNGWRLLSDAALGTGWIDSEDLLLLDP